LCSLHLLAACVQASDCTDLFSPDLPSIRCAHRVLDIRKFLDGIYVSEKGLATAE